MLRLRGATTAVAAVALLAAACGVSRSATHPEAGTVTPTAAAGATAMATPPSGGMRTSFGDGTWTVGAQIAAGTYQTDGGSACKWARTGAGGDQSVPITTVIVTGHAVATILPGDAAFVTKGCGTWAPLPSSGPQLASFGDGTWAAGVDVAPGTYSTPGGDQCQWDRLRDFTGTELGESASITVHASPDGHAVATITSTDAGFTSQGCGTWTVLPPTGPQLTSFGNGIWAVGIDIAPGTYSSSPVARCSWVRASDFTGDPGAVLASSGSLLSTLEVKILSSDRSFATVGCGTWKSATTPPPTASSSPITL
ncbi:MAG: hypothetical protein ABSA40_06710 [Candidatus Dormibacteria bacterium]